MTEWIILGLVVQGSEEQNTLCLIKNIIDVSALLLYLSPAGADEPEWKCVYL